MPTKIYVHCISKIEIPTADKRILSIGGTTSFGANWERSFHQVLLDIELGTFEYWASLDGRKARIVVGFSELGGEFLTTEDSGQGVIDLLLFPQCRS